MNSPLLQPPATLTDVWRMANSIDSLLRVNLSGVMSRLSFIVSHSRPASPRLKSSVVLKSLQL